jgi:carbamoyl-phosphate synthase large subunit
MRRAQGSGSKMNILVSSAGRRVQLLECFRDSAAALAIPMRVVAVDLNPNLSPACHMADARFRVPPCSAINFIPDLLHLCRKEKIEILVPTIDTELMVLSENETRFAEVGCRVVVSLPDVIRLARDKLLTSATIAASGVAVPKTITIAEFKRRPEQLRWPVIAKPNAGSSSIGIVRAARPEEVCAIEEEDYIVQELWEGREYTVNIFFDREGRLVCAVPHWRIETRSGEVSKGRTEDIAVLRETARKLAACLKGARGALCFQAIVTGNHDCGVFEINARFGGGYPLAHRAGAKFTTWLLEETLGLPSTGSDTWKSGVTMLRYDTAVFCAD